MSGAGTALLWTLQAEGKAKQRRVRSGSPAVWAVRLFWSFREIRKRHVWLTHEPSLSGTLPCPWDSPGKNTGVGYYLLLQCIKVKSESEVAQSCPTPATPWTAAYQAPPSMGFSRQEYWSGVPLPSPVLYTNNEKIEREIKETIPLTIATKIIKANIRIVENTHNN